MTSKNNNTNLESLQETAKISFSEGRFKDTLATLQELLDVLAEQQPSNFTLRGRILNNMGIVQVQEKHFHNAIDSFQTALEILKSTDDHLGKAQQWGNIGSAHRDLKEYGEAISNYENALHLYEKIGHDVGAADQFTNIAYAYAMNRQIDEAVKMYHKAAVIYEEIKDEEKSAMAQKNIAALEKRP